MQCVLLACVRACVRVCMCVCLRACVPIRTSIVLASRLAVRMRWRCMGRGGRGARAESVPLRAVRRATANRQLELRERV